MYLHLGQKKVITYDEIIGIFDLDNTTVSKKTRDYLNRAEKEGEVVTLSYELPKSFVVCGKKGKQTVYLSQISTSTLLRRADENLFE